jgi:RNA recognition motif-containing protein
MLLQRFDTKKVDRRWRRVNIADLIHVLWLRGCELTDVLFQRAETVATVNIVRDRAMGRARGFAFVERNDDEGARVARELPACVLTLSNVFVGDHPPDIAVQCHGRSARGAQASPIPR